mmetsp:Transcript_32239/g.49331  ORF Transcript_32239/g.49331 Transcript_32239/m.49331 type:complete len:136 (+) Transcript_32239:3718-4125(+)
MKGPSNEIVSGRQRHHQTFQNSSRPYARPGQVNTKLNNRGGESSASPNPDDIVKQYLENADNDFSMGLSSDKKATRFSLYDPRVDSVHREIIASEKDRREFTSMPFRLPYGSFRQKRDDALTSKHEESSPPVLTP